MNTNTETPIFQETVFTIRTRGKQKINNNHDPANNKSTVLSFIQVINSNPELSKNLQHQAAHDAYARSVIEAHSASADNIAWSTHFRHQSYFAPAAPPAQAVHPVKTAHSAQPMHPAKATHSASMNQKAPASQARCRANMPPIKSDPKNSAFFLAQRDERQELESNRRAAIRTNRPDMYTSSSQPKALPRKHYSFTTPPERPSNQMAAEANTNTLSFQLEKLFITCQQAKQVVDQLVIQEDLKAKPSFKK